MIYGKFIINDSDKMIFQLKYVIFEGDLHNSLNAKLSSETFADCFG